VVWQFYRSQIGRSISKFVRTKTQYIALSTIFKKGSNKEMRVFMNDENQLTAIKPLIGTILSPINTTHLMTSKLLFLPLLCPILLLAKIKNAI
jgi:hypothetical protein